MRRFFIRCSSLVVFPLLAILFLPACGGMHVYSPASTAGFDLSADYDINDEDIRSAFDARPQLPSHVQVAYYSFDPAKANEIEAMLEKLPGVTSVYGIPSLMATGERRYDADQPYWARKQPAPFSLKKLRLLAAKAHCDVLLVFDHGYRYAYPANALVSLDVLLLPVLFTPQLDVRAESYLDVYAIDVRNGFLYSEMSSTDEDEEEFVTIYSDRHEDLLADQWEEHVERTRSSLTAMLMDELAAGDEAGAAETTAAAVSVR